MHVVCDCVHFGYGGSAYSRAKECTRVGREFAEVHYLSDLVDVRGRVRGVQNDSAPECGRAAAASVVLVREWHPNEFVGVDAEHAGDLAAVREKEDGNKCGGADEAAEAQADCAGICKAEGVSGPGQAVDQLS